MTVGSRIGDSVVVVCGGLGLRLRPVLGDLPKVLAPVGQTPFLELLLNHFTSQGVRHVHLCLGVGASAVLESLPNLVPPTMSVTTSIEQVPLGVAGALASARRWLPERFAVVYGDVYPLVPLRVVVRAFRSLGVDALMSVCDARKTDEHPNVRVENGLVVRYSKRNRMECTHVDIGLIVLARRTLLTIKEGQFANEESLFGPLAACGRIAALDWPVASLHIGDVAHYREFCRWALRSGTKTDKQGRPLLRRP